MSGRKQESEGRHRKSTFFLCECRRWRPKQTPREASAAPPTANIDPAGSRNTCTHAHTPAASSSVVTTTARTERARQSFVGRCIPCTTGHDATLPTGGLDGDEMTKSRKARTQSHALRRVHRDTPSSTWKRQKCSGDYEAFLPPDSGNGRARRTILLPPRTPAKTKRRGGYNYVTPSHRVRLLIGDERQTLSRVCDAWGDYRASRFHERVGHAAKRHSTGSTRIRHASAGATTPSS